MKRSKRFAVLAQRPVNQDGLIGEWPEEGLIAMDSPFDPVSSVKVDNGLIVELDGKRRDQFDMIDRFIADYAINVERTEQAMRLEAVEIARMLVDIHVSREEIIAITTAITPAKAVEVMAQMNVVEMMMALQKMRARRTPSNQCHVTNLKDNPVQIAADAAEAGIRGFSEQETTVGIARYAPFNALALLVGSQCGRPGVLTQCSVEEATELELGMRGLTSYAETVSVYGTEAVFTDGDDTPWSKAFLASAYASRGLKMRYTSGTGSEALMGYSESKSMLYLESRCIFITKGAGVQGLQNGAVSCIGMTGAVPSGIRAVHFDAEDFDDYNILQRDLMVDGGLRPVTEAETIAIRQKAARAIQAVFRELGLPPIADEEVEAATYAHGSNEMPPRNVVEDLSAVEEMMKRNITGLDIVGALSRSGFEDIASNILNMLRQRVTGDYLQTSAILDQQFEVVSAVNDINDYQGPGTGYRISAERWAEIKNIPGVVQPDTIE
ncbi:MAG: propanediol/glycerol family dehydratase large subunit [Klebsiella pneumoniae]|nr:propanediol/glycerol family dehydratase large subunit [Klebsiella pneumoniae]